MQKIPTPDEILLTIDKYLTTIEPNLCHVEIGFFGGSFTGLSLEKQEELLHLVYPYIENNKVKSIRISTRPDYINEENLVLLHKYHVRTIELGAQSMDEEVLSYSGRGHTAADVIKAAKLIKDFGFELGLQMMVGLPLDTPQKAIATAQQIIDAGADNTRIYPTLVIKNTPLEDLFNDKKYTPLSLEAAISQVKDLVNMFDAANVTILRIGLHPSEGLLNGADLIAGPFHASFKELVMTEIWKEKLSSLFNTDNSDKNICIHTSAKAFNFAVGYFGSNRKLLLKYYKTATFKVDKLLKGDTFYVDYN